jgi:hypothetical protein
VRVTSGAALIGRILQGFLFMVSLPVITASDARAEKSAREQLKEKYFLLGLVGYNYTDRHISNYTVNGAGGFDVMLSSPTSGGSGITCCVRLAKKSLIPPRVKVRWQYDGCIYLIKDDQDGKADRVRHYYYKEAEVDVQRADGGTPEYLETHFYSDGTVQVAATDDLSRPRLKLDENRLDKSLFPKCKNDEKPEQ